MSSEINQELVEKFLADKHLWNNLDHVLRNIAKKDPNKLAELNAQITSLTLSSLNDQKYKKQQALWNLYLSDSNTPLLFFNMYYASKELYPEPYDILNDCISNQDSFLRFIEEYKNQKDLSSWKKSYDQDGWLDKLDKWLETDEGQKFLNEDYLPATA